MYYFHMCLLMPRVFPLLAVNFKKPQYIFISATLSTSCFMMWTFLACCGKLITIVAVLVTYAHFTVNCRH